jgi:hypothetical protein
MAIIGEAVAAAISANWNVGTGGTKPSIITYLTTKSERDPNLTNVDAIFVWLPLPGKFDRVTDKYRNETYDIIIKCSTITSSARQVIIENEVDRIFAIDGVLTGCSTYFITKKDDVTDRSHGVDGAKFISELGLRVITYMASGATAYGSATVAALVCDTLTVNTSADIPLIQSAGAISIKPSGDTDDYLNLATVGGHPTLTRVGGDRIYIGSDDATDIELMLREDSSNYLHFKWDKSAGTALGTVETIGGDLKLNSSSATGFTLTQLEDLLMYGSANAAWVPCQYVGATVPTDFYMQTYGLVAAAASTAWVWFDLPLPTTKGTLKLYCTGARIDLQDADANNYIDRMITRYRSDAGVQNLSDNSTNRTAQGTFTDSFAAVDCSPGTTCYVRLLVSTNGADNLKIASVEMQCYYA